MTALMVRPAVEEDVDALLAITKEAGTGMTTVPQTKDALAERIANSQAAFQSSGKASAKDTFFFTLDDGDGAVGMACIFPNLGEDRPFYSYRLSHIGVQAPESDLRASTDILFLVNDFHGYTEIGTLLVGERARGKGAGRFLSLSRFMFMGAHQDRFGENVMAEIRGWFGKDGNSPFWDHVAAKFFDTTFEEADRLSANDFRFISHLMPKFPIYVSLLHQDAQKVIGKPHKTSGFAMNLLQSEGFFWSRCVDIFDAGPSVECPLEKIRTVSSMTRRTLTISDNHEHISDAEPFLVSPMADKQFACVMGHGHRSGKTVVVAPEVAHRARLTNGATVYASPLKG